MITAPRSAWLKGHCWSASSSSDTWIPGRWPKDVEQRLFLWWLRSSKSSFPWWRLGPSIYHPQDVCHIWNRLMCWDVIQVWAIQAWHTQHNLAGVQGEVYQADLLGIGTVAVKISRRNDDYAKGDLGGKIWKLWRSLTLTLLIPHSKWLDSNDFSDGMQIQFGCSTGWCHFFVLDQRWNGLGSPFPLTEMHAFQLRTCVSIAETEMVQFFGWLIEACLQPTWLVKYAHCFIRWQCMLCIIVLHVLQKICICEVQWTARDG